MDSAHADLWDCLFALTTEFQEDSFVMNFTTAGTKFHYFDMFPPVFPSYGASALAIEFQDWQRLVFEFMIWLEWLRIPKFLYQADLLVFEVCGQMSDISQLSHEYRQPCLWSESNCEDLLSVEDSLSSSWCWSNCTSILSTWRCPMKTYGTELLAPPSTKFAPCKSAW